MYNNKYMNIYPVPDLATAYYANPSAITYTVIPYLMGRFKVADYAPPYNEYFLDVPLKSSDPLDIVVPAGTRVIDRPNYIKQQLKDLVEDAIEVAIKNDINMLIEEEENSPPIKILREQPVDVKEAVGKTSYFQVVRINNSLSKEYVVNIFDPLVYKNYKIRIY